MIEMQYYTGEPMNGLAGIIGRQLTAQPARLENRIDPAQQVIRGNPILDPCLSG